MICTALLSAGLAAACNPPAAPAAPAPAPVVATAEDCAVYAAIMKGELIRKEDTGAIPLPAPLAELKPVASRPQRWLDHVEKLKGWDPKNIPAYDRWVLENAYELEQIDGLGGIWDLVIKMGEPRPAYRLACDWGEQGITFDPDEEQPNQWLTFTMPMYTSKADFAVVEVSYGYTNTHARGGTCAAAKQEDGSWRFLECYYGLVS